MEEDEPALTPELELLRNRLDDLVEAHGWTPVGYYFDDSPFEGLHLIREEMVWKLYRREGGTLTAELRFADFQDASRQMLLAFTSMKQGEVSSFSEEPFAPQPLDGENIEQENTYSEDAEDDDEADPVDTVVVFLFLLLVMSVCAVTLWIFSGFLQALSGS